MDEAERAAGAASAAAELTSEEKRLTHGLRLTSLDSTAARAQLPSFGAPASTRAGPLASDAKLPGPPAGLPKSSPPGPPRPSAAPAAGAKVPEPAKPNAAANGEATAAPPPQLDAAAAQRIASLTQSTSTAATLAHFSAPGPLLTSLPSPLPNAFGGGLGFGSDAAAALAALAGSGRAPSAVSAEGPQGGEYAAMLQQLAAAGGLGSFAPAVLQQQQLLAAQMPWLALGLQAWRP